MKQYERVSDVAETEVLWRSDFQSGSRVINLFFCISMTFIVISFKKIVTNNQTLKLADFTCNLGFGHSKLTKSRVLHCSLIWYEAKILGQKESIGFKNLVYTREYKKSYEGFNQYIVSNSMSWFSPDLVWYKQEPLWRGPFQLCRPGKEEQLSKIKKIFCPIDQFFFTLLCRYGYFLFCILCLTYQRSAKS